MGGQKLQSLWGSATNFALAGTLFGASISLLSLFCYCCRKTQRESLNSCRALFGGSIILLFLFCYCCQRKSKKTPPLSPRSESTLSNTTATLATAATYTSGIAGIAPMEHPSTSLLEISHWFPEAPTPPPPYELVPSKKYFDSPPSYDVAVANIQSQGYV